MIHDFTGNRKTAVPHPVTVEGVTLTEKFITHEAHFLSDIQEGCSHEQQPDAREHPSDKVAKIHRSLGVEQLVEAGVSSFELMES